MKNKRIMFIILLFIILFFGNIFEASGASIDGGTNPGKAFQTASNWVGGNLPGSYTDSNGDGIYDFNVSNNTPLYIDGYVKLTGNLNLIRWGNLYIQDNAVFIIDGDFNLGDCSDVYLGENAILYITGNLNVVNITNQYWYTKIYQDKNSNVVIEKKNLTSISGNFFNGDNASVVIYPRTDTSGTVYSTHNGSSASPDGLKEIDGETEFETNEETLSELITSISESIDEETQCITLSIPAGSTHIIHSGETETYCYIELEQGSWSPALSPGKLIIEDGGTLNLTRFNDITTGQISNYGVLNIDSLYIKTGQNNGFSTTFYNAGTINATRGISFGKKISDYNYDYSDSEYLTITCGSVINANNGISFYINKPYFKVIGKMISPSITIYNSDGYNYSGNLIVDACTEIRTENLTINGNINNIKIYGHIAADNINSSKELIVSDDEENQTSGILTIGGLTTGIKYSVNKNSILNLCYNPTKSLLHNKVSSGIYVNDVDLEKSEDGADYIGICEGLLLFLYGEETGYSNDWTPEDESDINGPKNETNFWNYVNGHNKAPKAKSTVAAYSSYDNCMNELNINSFLPIELTYFKITDGNFEWETKSEMDNDYFVIEYSKNGTDWTECTDHIQSQSNTGWTYSCPVPETTKGSTFSYYRLKQVDLDGTFTYSDILSTSWKVPTLQSVRSQSVRCNILGQYSDKFGPVMIYNGEKRVIMKE